MKSIVAGCEWRHEELGRCLLASSKFRGQVRFTDEVKDVDFMIPQVAVGIYVVCNNDVENMKARKKVVTMKPYANDQIIGVVIVRRIANDTKNFLRLQQLATLNFGFKTVIVTEPVQAANFIQALASARRAEITCEPKAAPTTEDLLKPLKKLPQLGPARAKKLLKHFRSIARVCTASLEELAEVIGVNAAHEVKNFVGNGSQSASEAAGSSRRT